jgi:hypothetical protein
MNMTPEEQIARILRVDHEVVLDLEAKLFKLTGKKNVFKKIAEENEITLRNRLDRLNLGRIADSKEVYDALISKVEADDSRIYQSLGLAKLCCQEFGQRICDFLSKNRKPVKGFFLKLDKAKELLLNEPPRMVMSALGYSSAKEMLEKEDLLEVFSALRFLEDPNWLNNIFFKQYEKLTPDDFEYRNIKIQALNDKWAKAAEKFVAKKYHNISHLKELGVIFIIPVFLGISGETFRTILLLLHYLNEIKYYSDLFEGFSKKEHFTDNMISLLRGDVLSFKDFEKISQGRDNYFLIVQRYLSKLDDNDQRLFLPHVNPEAFHWLAAEKEIVTLEKWLPKFQNSLDFWDNLSWVGDFFKDESGIEVLVSFNIVDTTMSLAMEKVMVKYLYHQQESLWNEIFFRYFGEEQIRKIVADNILKSYFTI